MSTKPTNPKDLMGVAKIPASVISRVVLMEVGVGMFEGACKYGRHNYRAMGVVAGIYHDATHRHLDAWWEGQDLDPDSGLNHITKAICSLIVLRDSMIRGTWVDDRPPALPPEEFQKFMDHLNARTKAIHEKYKDKVVKHFTQLDSAVPGE